MKKLNVILGITNVVILSATIVVACMNKNVPNMVESQFIQSKVVPIIESQNAMDKVKLLDMEYYDANANTVWLKSNYSIDIAGEYQGSSDESIVITTTDFNEIIEANKSEETEAALRAFESYCEGNLFAEEQLYGGGQPQVQVFQNNEGTWSMIYDIKCGELYEYETKLVRYIDGEAREAHLGYSDIAIVGDGFAALSLEGVASGGLWTSSLIEVLESDINIRFLGNGHEEQIETGDFGLVYEVAEDINIEEQYDGVTRGRIWYEDFNEQYDLLATELGVNVNDMSECQMHWSDDVYDSYYYWLLEGVK